MWYNLPGPINLPSWHNYIKAILMKIKHKSLPLIIGYGKKIQLHHL